MMILWRSLLNCPCGNHKGRYASRAADSGFTMIEVLVVLVIIAIAAMMVVPMMSSAADMQLRSVSNMIAADLEYAKSMAIGKQKVYSVVFDASAETYQLEDPNGVIKHPVKKGFDYVVNLASDNRTDRVDIASVDFDSTNEVKFDYLGSPYNGTGTNLNSGTITLQAEGMAMTITVAPVTGYISISD
ncbi:MAG: prepilin-type N-terminal cleavage/methylation domain-containing protein [Planctomycetota bacterium]|nr:MAG: prepilin-type N-terminal cleavage/methylation domain-containing protein [Planctomycetota bacterium]